MIKMASSQDGDNQGLALGVVFSAIILAVGLAVGVAMHHVGEQPEQAVSTSEASGAADSSAPGASGIGGVALGSSNMLGSTAAGGGHGAVGTATMTTDAASVQVENGVVKFYFASGKAELAQEAKEALGDIVKGVAAGQTAVISGFHDATGDQAQNEELAKQRALAVRDTLISLGIGEDKLEMRKPDAAATAGSQADARRVDVRLQ